MRKISAYERAIASEYLAREYIAKQVEQKHVVCPKCQHRRHYKDTRDADALRVRCRQCHWPFNLLRGTLFMQTHIEMRCWLYIIYVYSSSSIPDQSKAAMIVDGCSITVKVARRALRRLREYLADQHIYYGADDHDMILRELANHRRRHERQKDTIIHDIRPHQIRFPSQI